MTTRPQDYAPQDNAPPRRSAGHAPVRPAGSIRRTTTIDATWPQGRDGPVRLFGMARDIITPLSGGSAITSAQASMDAILQADRTIVSLTSKPERPALARLCGERGGGGMRKALAEAIPDELERGTPLYLLLDDIAGTSLVSGWAWSQWDPEWMENQTLPGEATSLKEAFAALAGICTGFAPGSSALDPACDRGQGTPTTDLRHPDDPEGWHAYPQHEGMAMRRARRIDVEMRDGLVRINSAFQDSATTPQGGRSVVHEYSLSATADPQSLELLSLEAVPHVLPFVECPGATAHLARLIGTPLPDLRAQVLAQLRGTEGCTHLNDAMRALADVPALLASLQQSEAH